MAFFSDIRHRTRATSPRRRSLRDIVSLGRQRRQLARLDDRALADIGLTREEALREARRPLWDVPDNWRR